MKALVEFTYTYEVEVPDDTDKQDIITKANHYHQADLDTNESLTPSHVEVTYID